jgi:hypothetical protein
MQVDAELSGCGVHQAQTFGHHFFANTVSRNHGDAVCGHGLCLSLNHQVKIRSGREDNSPLRQWLTGERTWKA